MVRTSRGVVWGLIFVFLVVGRESNTLPISDAEKAAMSTATGKSTRGVVKPLSQDSYEFLIRKGLVPLINHGLLQMGQNLGTSALHRLARAWHAALVHQLGIASTPESFKTTAAEVHKSLGGQGDFIAAALQNETNGEFKLSKNFLKDEFLSYANFFLHVFVPKDISRCVKKPENLATKCIAEYEQALQAALNTTMLAFFHFGIPRARVSRILTTSFICTAVSPCPFAHLVEPAFVYKAIKNQSMDFTKPLESIKSTLSAEPCPAFKAALLRVHMAHGVTPADIMNAKNLKEEFEKIPHSKEGAINAEKESIMDALKISLKDDSKKGEGADVSGMENAGQILTEVLSHFGASHPKGVDGFLNSPLGSSIVAYVTSDDVPGGRAYLDRLTQLLEGQKADGENFESFLMVQLAKELSDALGAEGQEDLHLHVPLLPAKIDSLDEAAKTVLETIRGFKFQAAPFLKPKDDKAEEKKDEAGAKKGKK